MEIHALANISCIPVQKKILGCHCTSWYPRRPFHVTMEWSMVAHVMAASEEPPLAPSRKRPQGMRAPLTACLEKGRAPKIHMPAGHPFALIVFWLGVGLGVGVFLCAFGCWDDFGGALAFFWPLTNFFRFCPLSFPIFLLSMLLHACLPTCPLLFACFFCLWALLGLLILPPGTGSGQGRKKWCQLGSTGGGVALPPPSTSHTPLVTHGSWAFSFFCVLFFWFRPPRELAGGPRPRGSPLPRGGTAPTPRPRAHPTSLSRVTTWFKNVSFPWDHVEKCTFGVVSLTIGAKIL